ncbi:MAG: hypothetical protein IKB85_00105 [Bacteroidales bacterium]|nr:hypothetical protein [Bacteroidales bacterium]
MKLKQIIMKWRERKPSLRKKVYLSLGSLATILLLSGLLSILEYRRMSNYVSDLITSNINSIVLSQRLSDLTQEHNHQMLSVVVMNDISLMPEFREMPFAVVADSLRTTFTSESAQPMLDSVVTSFDDFVMTSRKFDEVFLADTVNTGEWFFGTLQPKYNSLIQNLGKLNELIHEELKYNSENFDAGFYRSIIPGVVSVSAGLILILLLLYFIMVNYVRPIYRISEGIDNYRASARRHVYEMDGDDQLANINTGVGELIEENLELKRRVKALKEERTTDD